MRRLRKLPALVRDAAASLAVVCLLVASARLPAIEVPVAYLLVVPALLLAALAFGRGSALLAALLTACAARLLPSGAAAEEADTALGLAVLAVLFCLAIGGSALLEALRRRREEAERAHAMMDVAVRRATGRLEDARRRLREAEDRLAEAERQARLAARRRPPPPPPLRAPDAAAATFEAALRSEGGI